MGYKCLNCDTEMIVHNQIKSDMIDNQVGNIWFECPHCRQWRKTAFPIVYLYAARATIDAGESVLDCNNFDDFLKKLEEKSWKDLVARWDKIVEV